MKRLILLAAVLSMCSCTVVPPLEHGNGSASYDGSDRNSGIVGVLQTNQILVTDGFRSNYNGLIARFGKDFPTVLSTDAGLTPLSEAAFTIKDPTHRGQFTIYPANAKKSYYAIDAEHFTKYLDMVDWSNSGVDPANPLAK